MYISSALIDSKFHINTHHYNDVMIRSMVFQITSLTIVNSTINSGADQRKHQSSASLDVVRGIHRWPVNSPHKWPATRKMFPFDDVIMHWCVMPCCVVVMSSFMGPGVRFKNTCELVNLGSRKLPLIYKPHIFECMGKIFCMELQRAYHTKCSLILLTQINQYHGIDM